MITTNLLAIINVVFIVGLLLLRRNNPLPNKILAAIFIVPALNFVNNINILSESIYNLPYIYFLVQGTAVLFAPLVYYYITLLTGTKITYQKILFGLTLLLLCFDIYMAADFFLKPAAAQTAYIASIIKGPYPPQMEIYSLLFFILQLIYFSICAKEVYQYTKDIKEVDSDLAATKSVFLTRFITIFWVLTFITIGLYIFIDTLTVEYIALPIVISTIYLFILYYAFHYNAVFTEASYQLHVKKGIDRNIAVLQETSDAEKITYPETLPGAIELLLEHESVFKNAEINLQNFAEQLNTPAYQVSKAINHGLNTNFYDLINKKRVEASQKLLAEIQENNLTVEGIAYEVGFNSRTAFYRAFKKYTGKNPSDFIKN